MKITSNMRISVNEALAEARFFEKEGADAKVWKHLVRAHIISQPNLLLHLRVHGRMFAFAVGTRAYREATGQVVRLILAPLGQLLGRIPWGNSGRSSVSLLAPAPLPADIKQMYAEAGIEVPYA